MTKAICAPKVKRFSDIPNVGPATADDFERLGLRAPAELAHCDAYELYHRLCRITGARHDPCVINVFLSAVALYAGRAIATLVALHRRTQGSRREGKLDAHSANVARP